MDPGRKPHVVMFPFPVQGHIVPMMHLASKLLDHGFMITFVHTEFNYSHILRDTSEDSSTCFHPPLFRFITIPDGLPPSHGRAEEDPIQFTSCIDSLTPSFELLMAEIVSSAPALYPVSCIVSDAACSWTQDVANKFAIPRVALWTVPAHAILIYYHQTLLLAKNIMPFKGKEDLERLVDCVPGVTPFRASDLISFLKLNSDDMSTTLGNWILNRAHRRSNEALWNLGNNIYELEKDAAQALHAAVESFLPIGPLCLPGHSSGQKMPSLPRSLWVESTDCQKWLDAQEPSSVVYISLGSFVTQSEGQLEEIALGVEASGHPFLWAVRERERKSDILAAFEERVNNMRSSHHQELEAGIIRKGMVVKWVPQREVLSHAGVGSFLTHCGWNSLMEGLSAGVPILAMAGSLAEQRLNQRYVVDVWKVGLELKTEREDGLVERHIVERAIRDLMCSNPPSPQASALRQAAATVQSMAERSLGQNGDSYTNLQTFVNDITHRAHQCMLSPCDTLSIN